MPELDSSEFPLKPRETLSRIVPYVAGRSISEVMAHYHGDEPILKLASNESPLGCPVSMDDLAPAFETIHYYPHQISTGLFSDLAQLWGLSELSFIVGNGSDELIGFTGFAFLNPGDEVLTSRCTFSEYRFTAYLMDTQLIEVPLASDWRIDLDGIIRAITDKTKIIYVANPNNPTGLAFSVTELRSFLKQVPAHIVVVLDEAYAEFADGESGVETGQLLVEFPNLILLRTFSKLYGLAGFRIGYAVASPEIILLMKKVSAPFNVNTLALVAAKSVLGKSHFIDHALRVNRTGKAYLYAEFKRLGLRFLDSQANFIFVFLPIPGKLAFEKLLEFGIIIRALDSFGVPDAIRVTIGLDDQNRRFIKALETILL